MADTYAKPEILFAAVVDLRISAIIIEIIENNWKKIEINRNNSIFAIFRK